MHPTNKFYLLLLLAVITAGSIFTVQLIKTRKITVKPSVTPLFSEGYYENLTENDDQILGNPGAPLTLVLFSDFSCSACRLKYFEINKFVREHPLDVRLFLKDLPRQSLIFKTNDLAHRSAFCAGKQDKYWQYVDILYTQKNVSNESGLTKVANDLKLDTASWWQCVNSEDAKQKIAHTLATANTLGIDKVPTIYANNKRINLDNDVSITEMLTKLITK
ncbi:MAG: thioredoxin domain-containing protein [Candidatus Magasanikbacteria bacterium]|jgi:protein-disulfide isomerase